MTQILSEKMIHLDDETKTRQRILMNFIYPDEYPMSAAEQWILERWKQVYRYKKRFKADGTAMKMIVEWSILQGKKISEATAYRDLINAQWFYGELFHTDPEFKLLMYAEWYEELAELARESQNFKAAKEALDSASSLRLKIWEAKNKAKELEKPETPKVFNLQVNTYYQTGKIPPKTIVLDDLKNKVSQEEIALIANNVPSAVTGSEMMKMLRKPKNQSNEQESDAE